MAQDTSHYLPFSLADLPPAPLDDVAQTLSPSERTATGMRRSVFRGGDLPDLPASLASLVTWATPIAMQVGAATLDFGRNYKDMRDANWIGADKYFHCKANCQAMRRGRYGEGTARAISDIREAYDEYVKGYPTSDVQADQAANRLGRMSAKSSPAGCDIVCSSLRPPGLPLRY
jgi:Serum amyloid A protein